MKSNLAQYLSNHLAGSVAGVELVKLTISENRGSKLAGYLEMVLRELQDDQEVVRRLLQELGSKESMVKEAGAWTLEKLVMSPVSGVASTPQLRPVVELEGIQLGTLGRLSMWLLLERFHRNDPRFAFADFEHLRERAERQAAELERFREEAAAAAFLK